ncbi:hypothetical protein E2562_033902 [Oryza meyeriana var. granulata]|uniref:Uncharacterized protein n=1 Tax=Oryza meyeriana var. granulata TaxID=110450 RepID=A0A6G1BQ78_9ORYZ|nr:hypothetical protein E2562_033902 [Oryza meyeriana var. granulata]
MTWPVLLLHLTPHQLQQSSPCHDARRLSGSKKPALMERSAALSSAMQLRFDDDVDAGTMEAVAGGNKERRRNGNAIFRELSHSVVSSVFCM